MRGSPLRVVTGCVAFALLVSLGLVVPHWGAQRFPAVVKAAQILQLSSIAPGRYQWSLRSGEAPSGYRLRNERLLLFERSELVQLELRHGLASGQRVAAGDTVATLRSLLNQRRLAELAAQKQVLVARQTLLQAGDRPEKVQEARQRVELARAVRQAATAELQHLRLLASRGLVSSAELEVAELEDEVHRLGIVVAESGVAVARSSARPEALAELTAEIAVIDAGIAELEALQGSTAVVSPISGVAEVGGADSELTVYQLDPVFLSFAVDGGLRSQLPTGKPVSFATNAVPGRTFQGEVTTIARAGAPLGGRTAFWACARLANPDGELLDGMVGTIEVEIPMEILMARTAVAVQEEEP